MYETFTQAQSHYIIFESHCDVKIKVVARLHISTFNLSCFHICMLETIVSTSEYCKDESNLEGYQEPKTVPGGQLLFV